VSRIELSGVTFRYSGENAFRIGIEHLEVPGGECAAIVGPSGSGKTTLLSLVAGILVPQAGEVRVGDAVINRLGESARRHYRIHQVGQVFQAFELLNYLDVIENVLLPRYIDSSVDAEARERAAGLLDSVGLADRAQTRPSRLSHGERQRVAVCRALLNRPQLLLADEPTGNLDAANKQNVVDLLTTQARAHGCTLLMVTHDRGLLRAFERIIDFEQLVGAGS